MDTNLQREFAKRAGEEMLTEYDYHLSMVENPLPFGVWRMKYAALQKIQNAPDYMENFSNQRRELQLCNELGY